MKRYYFAKGKVECEGLTAEEIKKNEEVLGKLCGVSIDRLGYVPCVDDWKAKPVNDVFNSMRNKK